MTVLVVIGGSEVTGTSSLSANNGASKEEMLL